MPEIYRDIDIFFGIVGCKKSGCRRCGVVDGLRKAAKLAHLGPEPLNVLE